MTDWVDVVRSCTETLKIFPSPQITTGKVKERKLPRNVQMKLMEQNILLSGSLTGQVRDSLQWHMRLCFNAISIPTAKPA